MTTPLVQVVLPGTNSRKARIASESRKNAPPHAMTGPQRVASAAVPTSTSPYAMTGIDSDFVCGSSSAMSTRYAITYTRLQAGRRRRATPGTRQSSTM